MFLTRSAAGAQRKIHRLRILNIAFIFKQFSRDRGAKKNYNLSTVPPTGKWMTFSLAKFAAT